MLMLRNFISPLDVPNKVSKKIDAIDELMKGNRKNGTEMIS
jgi:hypothetical protein